MNQSPELARIAALPDQLRFVKMTLTPGNDIQKDARGETLEVGAKVVVKSNLQRLTSNL